MWLALKLVFAFPNWPQSNFHPYCDCWSMLKSSWSTFMILHVCQRWSTYVNVFFSEFYLRTCKMRESERERCPTGEISHGLYGSWRLWKPRGLRQLDGSEEQQSCDTKSASRTCEAISQDCRTKLCTQLPGTTMCEFAWLCDSAWCFSLWGRFSCPHSTLGHMICLSVKSQIYTNLINQCQWSLFLL